MRVLRLGGWRKCASGHTAVHCAAALGRRAQWATRTAPPLALHTPGAHIDAQRILHELLQPRHQACQQLAVELEAGGVVVQPLHQAVQPLQILLLLRQWGRVLLLGQPGGRGTDQGSKGHRTVKSSGLTLPFLLPVGSAIVGWR